MKPVQLETRILPCRDGDGVVYAVGYCGIWLTLEVSAAGAPLCVDMHAPFPIADQDSRSLLEFIGGGAPAHDCRLLSGPCWTVQSLSYSASALVVPAIGTDDYDATVLHNLTKLVRDAPEEAEALRVSWRVRLARRVVRWAVPQ